MYAFVLTNFKRIKCHFILSVRIIFNVDFIDITFICQAKEKI